MRLRLRIPCYQVQYLNQLTLRVLDNEVSGEWRFPDAADVLRSSGSPEGGTCLIEDQIFRL